MTATEYVRSLGATRIRKDGDKQTAVIRSVSDMSRFASVLKANGLEYKERFADGGKAIRFVYTDGPINH
jgi:hypothetical protein